MQVSGMPWKVLLALALGILTAVAQDNKPPATPEQKPAAAKDERSSDLEAAAAQRNENVKVNLIDNNAVKESLVRLGAAVTPVDFPTPVRSHYGAEYGRPLAELPFLSKQAGPAWHATLSEEMRNSVFNARTFFQVGPVQPSHSNTHGLTAGGPLRGTYLHLDVSLRQVRGMVNGNVLVPQVDERTSTSADPAVRAVVARMLASYGTLLPNRPDIDPRALNLNSPERIDTDREVLGLERPVAAGRLAARYQRSTNVVDSFQFVAGQNPNTALRSHRAQLSWEQPLYGGVLSMGAWFDRLHSLLTAEPNAFANRVRSGHSLDDLGPSSEFPIDRVRNVYRSAVQLALPRGGHRWVMGADWSRFQLNGREALNSRGYFTFSSDFGNTAIQNLRAGTPTIYEASFGEFHRGFRSLEGNFFLGDTWTVNSRWQLNFGLRYNLRTAPYEVNGRSEIPYGCSCRNVSPIFGFALRLGDRRNFGIIRANYSVSYGEIFDVTYQQARLNAPEVRSVLVYDPSLLNPLSSLDSPTRTGQVLLSPDLGTPYAHQYNLVWQRQYQQRWNVQLAYLGSRSIKLLTPTINNRAQPVAGIPFTVKTANQRRPDPLHYDVMRVGNAGIAYLDALQARVDHPVWHGLLATAVYTFSKAIDEGSSYIGTAAQGDLTRARSQSEFNVRQDKRGLSDFDQPHSLVVQTVYDLPVPKQFPGWTRTLFAGWQVSGAVLFRKGTPFTLYVGSDNPGFGNVDGGPGDRPNLVDPSVLGRTIDHPDTSRANLPRAAFDYIHPGESRGSLGRNTFRKAGIRNLNFALGRTFELGTSNGHHRTLSFRAEAFNLANHPQFDEPQPNLSAPAFGRITNTLNDGRVFQFSLRLSL